MGHRQKGKGKKRRKSWHRGLMERIRWEQAAVGIPKGDASGAPAKLRRGPGKRHRGEAL